MRRTIPSVRTALAVALVALSLTTPLVLAAEQAKAAPAPVGHPGSGFLSNFDVYNNEGVTCEGFEVQIEDVTPAEAPYQYYGTFGQPTITTMAFPNGHSGIDVVWSAQYSAGSWSATAPAGSLEHFGVYVVKQPGLQHLSWLCEDPAHPGTLVPTGGTAVGDGYTNNTLSPVPIVTPAIVPTPAGEAVQQNLQNGPAPAPGAQSPLDAVWYYRYAKSSPDAPALEELTPENTKFAVAAMSQSQINDNMNLVDGGQSAAVATEPVNAGDAASVWVVEEYAYTGPYDDAHTALCNETPGDPNNCANFVGDLLSTTVLAANLANGGHRFPVNVAVRTNGSSSKAGGTVSSNQLTGVNANPGDIGCGDSCTTVVDEGATVTLTASANPTYSFTGWSGACTGTSSTCTVTASQARSVTANFSQGLTVTPPASTPKLVPRLTAKLSIKGTGFGAGASASVSGGEVTVTATKVTGKASAATMALTLAASANAEAGLRDVTITTPDGKSVTCVGCLEVSPIPVVDSVSPASRPRNTTLGFTLTGTGFAAGLKVTTSGQGCMVKNLVVTPTSVSFNLQIAKTASPGLRTFTLTNKDKGYGTATFSVT